MPHTPSAFKRLRQNEERRIRNLSAMRTLKTSFQKAETALKADPAKAQEALRAAVAQLDRQAARGLIHHNTAARRKSRLMRLLNASASATSAASAKPAKKTGEKAGTKAKAEKPAPKPAKPTQNKQA